MLFLLIDFNDDSLLLCAIMTPNCLEIYLRVELSMETRVISTQPWKMAYSETFMPFDSQPNDYWL